MTTPKRISFPEVKTEVVPFDGGLNEAVSSLEMKAGELILCKNYYITEGSTGGYISLAGYERFDGRPKPSSVAATELDFAAREAARTAVTVVPGEDAVLGCFIFETNIYAFRNKAGGLTAGLYKSTIAGWVEIDTSAAPLNPDGRFSFAEYDFGGTIGSVILWVDGKNKARMFNGTTVTVLDNSGMDPNDKPVFIEAVWDRVLLVYTGGSVQSSNVGDPTDFLAGTEEFITGFEITSIQSMVGDTVVITGETEIKVLKRSDTGTDWLLTNFSDSVGAYPYTVQKLFDTLIFMSDMGVTTLSATQDFGDFATSSLSEKIKKTLFRYKDNISSSIIVRSLNQYRLYFDNGKFLIFSFYNKKLRGVTLGQYQDAVISTSEGRDSSGNPLLFFTSISGYIYQMDIGTSFDGDNINTRMSTSYYHYKSPRNWKSFQNISLEVSSLEELDINIKPYFDYSERWVINAYGETVEAAGIGGVWGESEWGTMIWSLTDTLSRVKYNINGIGANISLSFYTDTAFNRQHTIHNMIMDYIILGRQL